MLSAEMIRDVGRALPWLAAEPRSEPIPTGVSMRDLTELLDAHAEGLRIRHDTLYPVIDRAGHKLAAPFKELDPTEIGPNSYRGVASRDVIGNCCQSAT